MMKDMPGMKGMKGMEPSMATEPAGKTTAKLAPEGASEPPHKHTHEHGAH